MDSSKKKRYTIIAVIVGLYVVFGMILRVSLPAMLAIYLIAALAWVLRNIWAIIAFYGNYLFSSGKEERAERIFSFCIRHKSRYPTVYLNYSIMLLRKGNAAEALEYLEKAENRTPKVITEKNIMLTKGSCHWMLGDIDKAISILEEMRSKFEYVNCHVLTTLAYMYFMKEDHEKALEISNMALEDSPDFGPAWDNIGQIYYATNRKAEAKDAFQKAIKNKSDLVDSLYYMARIAEDENDSKTASEYYQKAHDCKITALNTVTKEQIAEGYGRYFDCKNEK